MSIYLLVPVVLGALCFIWGRRGPPAEPIRVELDDDHVTLAGPGAPARDLELAELRAVDIFTTDEGPFVEDVFWVLTPLEGEPLVVPSGAEGTSDLLDRLMELEGFDAERVVLAMGSTDNARFACWRRPRS